MDQAMKVGAPKKATPTGKNYSNYQKPTYTYTAKKKQEQDERWGT